MPYERTIDIGIIEGVLARFSQSGRPIERYSVLLMAFEGGAWQTVRVYDNHLGTHHMHRYSRTGGKEPEAAFHAGPANEPFRRNRPSQGPLGSDNRAMEKLTRSQNTPGTDATFNLLGQIAVDPGSDERYPDGTVLIPADSPDASGLMSRAIHDRKPLTIVFPDGWMSLRDPPRRPDRCF